jgi:D-tyrosyl-tRNA(Tyr) deacylase
VRVVVQRVREARVTVAGRVIGEIGVGIVALVGLTATDTGTELAWMAEKVVGLRIFNDDDGKMNLDVMAVAGRVLAISQFTLYGDVARGRRPSFVDAARPEVAAPLYREFIRLLRERGVPVATGEFGADMQIALVNDGPVTLILERCAG